MENATAAISVPTSLTSSNASSGALSPVLPPSMTGIPNATESGGSPDPVAEAAGMADHLTVPGTALSIRESVIIAMFALAVCLIACMALM